MSASDEVINGWRECADPVELAAAVAAGVEVERNWGYDWHPGTANVTAEQFAGCLKASLRYRVPASWSWSPEPPAPVTGDDLRERIVKVIDDWHNTVEMWTELDDLADAVLAVLPPQHAPAPDGCEAVFLPTGVVDEFANDTADTITLRDVRVLAACRDACRAAVARRPSPKPPVPPWPGAVLSGLTDEDGVPTWLALAGQVPREQVRRRHGSEWYVRGVTGSFTDTSWVEVRAPRAVPEPETERVPWWEAVGREVFDQDGERVTIEHVQCGDGAGPSVTAYNAAEGRDTSLLRVPITVRGDGTVEVLKDGDR